MKVVLFCGGYGMRMRDGTSDAPKPMVMVGDRPLLWHVMRYYAHFGHTDFILCLGYGASAVKDFFLNYDETRSNDFTLSEGGRKIELASSDIEDWTITFVDTGLKATIGERLLAVRKHVEGEELFLANYADTLTDAPLPEIIERVRATGAQASLLAVPPQSSHHMVEFTDEGHVERLRPMREMLAYENGGYFVLRPSVFDVLHEGEELVVEAFARLAERKELLAYPYHGFWCPADTLKERAELEALYNHGTAPWMLWDELHGSVPADAEELRAPHGAA
ncbi:sugar phosphate nucleotidyltransferase [Longispora urticae]